MKLTPFLLISLFSIFFAYGQEEWSNGLYFHSKEVNQDNRTSLNLTPKKPLHFKNGFRVEFETNFRDGDGYYGNIIKIIGNDELNIDLVSHLNDDASNFWLVVKDSILFKYKWADIPNGGLNKWMKFKIEIDLNNPSISLSINGKKMIKDNSELSKVRNFEMVFGKSELKNFLTTDVCPMSIKDVKIFDKNNSLKRNWRLGKHTNTDKVYDEVNNEIAIAKNPKWLLDEHVFWEENNNFQFDNLLGTAYDIEGDRIFFIDQKAVQVYSTVNKTMKRLIYKGSPYPCKANTFTYNSYTKELWSYSFDHTQINKFDFENSKWSLNAVNCEETSFWHHDKIISPLDSTLITFGGYGYFKYKSVFKKFDKNKSWINVDKTNNIFPRYLSSSGVLNKDQFLIFGGFGSNTGDQSINSHNYYDLYSVSFDNFRVNKIWETNTPDFAPFTPLETMIIDSNSTSFYTLLFDNSKYNTHLKLARFGINEYEMTVFPDSIPYNFNDIKSNGTIILDSKKKKLIAFTTIDDNVNLFSLSYPPLLANEVLVEEQELDIPINYFAAAVVVLILLLILIFIIIIRKRATKNSVEQDYELGEVTNKTSKSKIEKKKTSSIYLFGGFQVFDKESKDITALFTPTLKQLFVLILLSGIKNEKGITSKKITSLLWSDKNENSARNNRNVNISKLRILLEKIGDIEMSHENTYWKITLGNIVYCDYSYTEIFLKSLVDNDVEEENLHLFLKTISAGKVCPDIKSEWMEDMRVDITNTMIESLEDISKTQKNKETLVLIASTTLKFDSLNEEAISLKCRSLYQIGKKGLARKCYNNFCQEYLTILDTEFSDSFKEIIE